MLIQATIQCECGCISRVEFQNGKHAYACPQCKKEMDKSTYSKLEEIMCEFGEWNIGVLNDSAQYGAPKMRAITLSIADQSD